MDKMHFIIFKNNENYDSIMTNGFNKPTVLKDGGENCVSNKKN